jgi:hypothetical protein
MKNELEFFNPSTGEVMKNSLGYQQVITTLTAVGRKISEQKFYEIAPADYLPVVMGNGAYKRSILNWRTYVKGEGFESGIMGNSGNGARVSLVDAAYDSINQNVLSWAKSIEYNLFELQEALQSNTLFSLIEARELSRRKQWDLGIQKTAFLGLGAETGLLNNSTVTVDTATITKRIPAMSSSEFNTFAGAIYEAYRSNCARTARPTHFIIPEADWNGLINFPDATYPLKTKLELLEAAFKTITQRADFKILPNAYCDKANFDTTNNRYVLLNYDETSVKMDIPIDYTSTVAGTVNGFTWENVAYGSFTGVVAQREKEMLYFGNTAT